MNISRRNALLGSVAAAALPIPALASDSPDSTLRTLWAKYIKARDAEMDAYNAADALSSAIWTDAGRFTGPEIPGELAALWDQPGHVVIAATDPASPLYQGDRIRTLHADHVAARQDHFDAVRERAEDDPRQPERKAALERSGELAADAEELRDQILATPARNFEDLRIKAAALSRDVDLGGDCLRDVPGDELFAALADDLKRLANG